MDIWAPGKNAGATPSGSVCVIALVDAFTKYVVAHPIPDRTASTLAAVLVRKVFTTYGVPERIISDNAKEFTGAVFELLYRSAGITQQLITPHNPKANGQIERFFRSMRAILAALAVGNPDTWDEYVTQACYAYNTSVHRSISNTPFFLMFGRDPPVVLQEGIPPIDPIEPGSQWYIGLKKARSVVRDHIDRAALSNKENYDRIVRPQVFEIGDAVLVYRAVPSNIRGPRKLLPKYVGPYRIEEIVGRTAKVRPIRDPSVPQGRLLSVVFDHLRHCEADRVMLFPPERRTDPAEIDDHLEFEEEW